VFHVLGICSASLSVIGSCAILFKILRGIRSTTPYDRIILGLSTCDIIASITIVVDHVLVPNKISIDGSEVKQRGICMTLNPISTLSTLWSVWYNNLLSVYFLLMVLSQLKRKDLVRKYERWMHISGIIVLINVIWYFNSGGYGNNYKTGSTCYLGSIYLFLQILGFPFWLSLLSILLNYGSIYAVVRKSLRANESSEPLAGPMPRQERLKKEVTTLMILYIGSFFVTWTPAFVFSILWEFRRVNRLTMYTSYPLRLLVATTLPLQGFLNAFIYFKPAYTRFRAANPNKSMRFVLYQALFNRTAPKTNYHHRNAQHVTHGSAYGHKITDITRTDPSGTDPSGTDPSGTDPSAPDPIAEEDVGVGITGIDFESTLLFDNAEDAPAERNDSPLEAVAEENDDSPDSNS